MAMAFIFIENHAVLSRWFCEKWGKTAAAIMIVSVFSTLPPYSPIRDFWTNLPNEKHWQVRQELRKLEQEFPTESIALQSALGPQVHRLRVSRIFQNQQVCQSILIQGKPAKIWVLSRHVSSHEIYDLEQCITSLESSDQFKKRQGYETLLVFERK